MTTIIPRNLDYSSKDQVSLEIRLRSLLSSVFPDWTEQSVANFGNVLYGLMAYVGDTHTFYIDQWARESRISTAQLRRSLVALVKLTSFVPSTASAATADVVLTLPSAVAANVTVPAGTVVRTQNITEAVRFQLLSDLTIIAGLTSGSVTVENTRLVTEVLVSDGRPDQRFRLESTPVVIQTGSPVVSFADGAYTRVDNFLDSMSSDRHFVLRIDADDRGTLVFGDGVAGAIPVGTGSIDYKVGGGSVGNVEPGSLTVVDGTIVDDNGTRVSLVANNAVAASGGAPRQSNAEIRQQAPRERTLVNRAIARDDFEVGAELVPGVSRALAITSQEDAGVAENTLDLYVVPTGGGTASSVLLDQVRGQFFGSDAPFITLNTLNFRSLTAIYQDVDHQVRAFRAAGSTVAEMADAIRAVLADYYSDRITASRLIEIAPTVAAANGITASDGDDIVRNPLVDFGFNYKDGAGLGTGLLNWSDVFNVVNDLAEVRKLDAANGLLLDNARADLNIGVLAFPRLGNVTIIDGDTGASV